MQADVEADEVGQLERSHGVVQPDPGAGVDVLRGAQALLVGAHRLGQEGHHHPIDDETRPVLTDDHLLAQLRRQLPDVGLGCVVGLHAARQLDQRHHWYRAEEVQAHETAAPLGGQRRREAGDADRTCIAGQDGGVGGMGGELGEQLALDLFVFEDRLDDELNPARGIGE